MSAALGSRRASANISKAREFREDVALPAALVGASDFREGRRLFTMCNRELMKRTFLTKTLAREIVKIGDFGEAVLEGKEIEVKIVSSGGDGGPLIQDFWEPSKIPVACFLGVMV
jgi:hypothetical protein